MKKLNAIFYKVLAAFILFFTNTMAYAQIDVDIDLGGKQEWYENPKIWIGVAIFLVILALIARGGKKS